MENKLEHKSMAITIYLEIKIYVRIRQIFGILEVRQIVNRSVLF